jgi:hypothetical protein
MTLILLQLQPSLVLSGDMHESCYYEHALGGDGAGAAASAAAGDAAAAAGAAASAAAAHSAAAAAVGAGDAAAAAIDAIAAAAAHATAITAAHNAAADAADADAAAAVPVVPEWTVTTFNPLQGTQFPGFGILSLYSQNLAGNLSSRSHTHVRNGRVSFHHCFLCPAMYVKPFPKRNIVTSCSGTLQQVMVQLLSRCC